YAVQIASSLGVAHFHGSEAGATLLTIGLVTHVVAEEKGPNGMPELGSPSVRRRRLAAELRRLREERNLTGEDVAKSLGWSAPKLARMELAGPGSRPRTCRGCSARTVFPRITGPSCWGSWSGRAAATGGGRTQTRCQRSSSRSSAWSPTPR